MSKITRPNIKLLTSDFSDLSNKNIFDFIDSASVAALRDYYLALCRIGDPAAAFMSYVGEDASDCIQPEDKDKFVPFSNRSDLMTLAYFLDNSTLAMEIMRQLD